MVHGLRLRDGRARVVSPPLGALRAGLRVLRLARVPGPQHGVGDNTANTNVIAVGGPHLSRSSRRAACRSS